MRSSAPPRSRACGPPPRPSAALGLLVLGACLGLPHRAAAESEALRFKVMISAGGIHRVTYEDLVAAGLPRDTTAETVRLTHRGAPVATWRRGGSGALAAGDEIVFRAERLRGEHSYFHDHARLNVYFLEIGGPAGPQVRLMPAAPSAVADPAGELRLGGAQHRERDLLLHRFSRRVDDAPSDDWFWHRLTQIDTEPFRLALDLRDLDTAQPVALRLALRGWSQPRGGARTARGESVPDHVVEVSLGGVAVGRAAWDAQDEHVLEIGALPAAALRPGHVELEVTVPKRILAGADDPLIDVVLLNWVELEYTRRGHIRRDQETFTRAAEAGWAVLETAPEEALLVFTGSSVRAAPAGHQQRRVWLEADPAAPREIHVVRDAAFRDPVELVLDRSSDLRNGDRQADYLMIAHPSLLAAVEPLAEFHRSRGLAVELIDVTDVYDEFSDGITEPRAIRDFVAHAYQRWRPPAPRFVLLVGDASWDTKNPRPRSQNYVDWTYQPGEVRRSQRNQLTPYDEDAPVARDLIPTWKHQGAEGHAASDNYFAAVTGDDHLPDLAIGRFPVVEPDEVAAIVDKTIHYASASAVGPWRRNLLWIANESAAFQRQSDDLAARAGAQGFSSTKIYPSPEEADNAGHQRTLLESLDEGQLLVHFLGHGGRYIWRTGPPDFRKNHDLFTLEHLDQLAPTSRLPIILSMTCYSAPFDHPTADSIGEKFLRLADRGAVAVLAASWRNSPGTQLSQSVLSSLLDGATVGEAILTAKRGLARRDLVETYNLLGDPAIAPPKPRGQLLLSFVHGGEGSAAVEVRSASGEALNGELLVEWLGTGEEILVNERRPAAGRRVELGVPGDARGAATGVSVYFWDEASGRDALGHLDLAPEGATAGASGAARTDANPVLDGPS